MSARGVQWRLLAEGRAVQVGGLHCSCAGRMRMRVERSVLNARQERATLVHWQAAECNCQLLLVRSLNPQQSVNDLLERAPDMRGHGRKEAEM